jgi:hypothetical protein
MASKKLKVKDEEAEVGSKDANVGLQAYPCPPRLLERIE